MSGVGLRVMLWTPEGPKRTLLEYVPEGGEYLSVEQIEPPVGDQNTIPATTRTATPAEKAGRGQAVSDGGA